MTICIVYYCHHIPSYLLYNLLFSLKRKGHLGSSEYYVLVVFFQLYTFLFLSQTSCILKLFIVFKSFTGYCNLNTQGLSSGQIKCDEYLLRWGMRVRHFKHTLSLKHTCVNISVKVKRFISAPLVASHGNAIGAFFFLKRPVWNSLAIQEHFLSTHVQTSVTSHASSASCDLWTVMCL